MTSSQVDFSAQFGGRDAATAVLPHFKALKAASQKLRLDEFPFAKLGFILRVDGEVSQYHLSGAGNLEMDTNGEYLSVDIGIMQGDRDRIPEVISAAILSSAEQIKALPKAVVGQVDFRSLKACLADLIALYKDELSSRLSQ